MRTYFETVIQLEVFHSYYNDLRCRDIIIEPTASCSRLLQQFGLLFKKTYSGMVLIGEKKNTGTENAPVLVPRISIPADTRFYFIVHALKPDFLNITDANMDALSGGRKFFLQNFPVPPIVNGGVAKFELHNNTPLEEAVIPGSLAFYAPVVIGEDPVLLRIKDMAGVIFTEVPVPRNASNEITTDRVMIGERLDEGFYSVEQIDGMGTITSSQGYFLSGSTTVRDAAGILAIEYNHFVTLHEDKEVKMEIRLSNRSIRWIYRLEIEKYQDPSEAAFTYQAANLFLNNNTNTVPSVGSVFTKTINAPPDPADNEKVRFSSNNLIPIRERPYQDVVLVNNVQPLIENMPTPNPVMMRRNGADFEAEMFLKIK